MELTLSILLLLMVGAWLGYREIGVSFLGIHIRDLISTKLFGTMQFVVVAVFIVGVYVINATFIHFSDETLNLTHITKVLVILCAIVMATMIVRATNQYTSAITAFWGAVAALGVECNWFNHAPLLVALLLSLIAAPIVGTMLFYLYQRVFNHIIYKGDTHLLIKNLYMKRLALVGIILGGMALAVNYALFVAPFLSCVLSEKNAISPIIIIIAAMVLSAVMIIPAATVLHNENHGAKRMRWALPSLYALITVLILGNVAGTLLLGLVPMIVSPSQIRECCKLSKGDRHRSLINIASITIATPIIAFLIAFVMLTVVKNSLIMLIVTCFVFITCMLVIQNYRQRRKHTLTEKALNDELTHSSETGDERNRLDVAAVTSQFNVMTNEIDIKHKELVNLSLYIKQQRQYLEDLGNSLYDLSNEDDVTLLRQQLRETAQKLNDNMRLTDEMDQFYNQVEDLHKNFVSRLLMRCSNLSEKEKRLAILLRLGFSSKDIAGMMNVEPKSVEVSRYRFRRKLKLERSVNIVEYLQMI
ncbi:MAG: hypothetical protein IK100_07650 [Muribaculaceae bacterium]|nr:hypothetical protein [Muribaculaceae bacterium]